MNKVFLLGAIAIGVGAEWYAAHRRRKEQEPREATFILDGVRTMSSSNYVVGVCGLEAAAPSLLSRFKSYLWFCVKEGLKIAGVGLAISLGYVVFHYATAKWRSMGLPMLPSGSMPGSMPGQHASSMQNGGSMAPSGRPVSGPQGTLDFNNVLYSG